MTAIEILASQIDSWGQRENYLVTREEFMTLKKEEGSEIKKFNWDNGDGTFFSCIAFMGRKFVFSSNKLLPE